MTQAYYEKWSEAASKMQEPFKAIAELNIKTMQSLSYLKPEELTHLKKPEELIEKQICLAIENGHKALDYLQKSFQVYEKTLTSLVKDIKNKSESKK